MGTLLVNLKSLLDFGTVEMQPVPKPPKKALEQHPLVHPDDRPLLAALNLRNWHAIVAGGAAINWYRGLPVDKHDIDLYCANAAGVQRAVNHLNTIATGKLSTNYATTFEVTINGKTWIVQVISAPQDNINTMFDNFDITACRIATDGSQWWWGPQFHQDHKTSTLRMTRFHKNSLRRYVKYVNYGYTPTSGLLQEILQHPDVCTDFHGDEDDSYGDI